MMSKHYSIDIKKCLCDHLVLAVRGPFGRPSLPGQGNRLRVLLRDRRGPGGGPPSEGTAPDSPVSNGALRRMCQFNQLAGRPSPSEGAEARFYPPLTHLRPTSARTRVRVLGAPVRRGRDEPRHTDRQKPSANPGTALTIKGEDLHLAELDRVALGLEGDVALAELVVPALDQLPGVGVAARRAAASRTPARSRR